MNDFLWLSAMSLSLAAACGVAWLVRTLQATPLIRKDGSSHEHVPLRVR